MSDTDARPRVLVAEAGHAQRLATGQVLGQAGYLVDETNDGDGAVASAAACRYHLILMGLELPGGDAIEAALRIRRLPHPYGDVPILAMTGGGIAPDQGRCDAAGIDAVLTSPIAPLALLEAAASWVAAADDPTWGLEPRPGVAPPLVNRRTLAYLEEDLGRELLIEILVTFVEESERRLRLLEERVGAGDAAGAADEAHALKGSAGTFGAMAMRAYVQDIERSGRAGQRERLTALLPQLRPLLVATCDQLRAQYPLPVP
jgi:CheY-like chemotaxis protein/HPt (histidine-containing phosphotransfer) domain-containing protein